MPAAVQTPRYSEFLKRLLGFKESRAFDIEDILLAVMPVFDAAAPEYAFPRGELRVCGGGPSNFGGAGQYSFIALENPVQSGCLLITENFDYGGANQCWLGLFKSTGLGASLGPVKSPCDGRGFPASNPPLVGDVRAGFDANNPSTIGNGYGWQVITINPPRIPVFVIPPGWSLVAKNGVANATMQFFFSWRIKFGVEASELGT